MSESAVNEFSEASVWCDFSPGGALPGSLAEAVGAFDRVCSLHGDARLFERKDGWSGAEWGSGNRLAFAPVLGGGFAVHRRDAGGEEWLLFSESGTFLSRSERVPLVLFVPHLGMEPGFPVAAHLFDLLAHEYERARLGEARSEIVAVAEQILRGRWAGKPMMRLWRDPAVTRFWKEALRQERTSVLRWRERQAAISRLYVQRRQIVAVKSRVLRQGLAWLVILLLDVWNALRRFALRPRNSAQGLMRLLTFDVVMWFFRTVRNNIGYSIALAIYGPFTFYFITQPLNPKAMWAVGKVRETYLNVTETLSGLVTLPPPVGGTASAVVAATPAAATGPVMTPSPSAAAEEIQTQSRAWQQRVASAKVAHLGFPVSTDFREVDTISWPDRMSHFKGLQIALEERMVFAARMGRIEQIESQMMFPLTVRNSWMEMSRYLALVKERLSALGEADPQRAFWQAEVERCQRGMLYVWDKILRFNRDYQYIVADEGREHPYKDRYLGEPLFALLDLTADLRRLLPGFRIPDGMEKFEQLSLTFRRSRQEASNDTLRNLKTESALFAQKDPFNGFEYRSYMTRHWEVLYLLQNKAQEASNFGLMAYTGSVKNAIYGLQVLHAAKFREFSSDDHSIRQKNREMYESVLNLLQADLVSIGPELEGRLPLDLDFAQRKRLIQDLNAFLRESEK